MLPWDSRLLLNGRSTILRFLVHLLDILDINHQVTLALVLFFTRRLRRPACTRLLRPSSLSPVPRFQRNSTTPVPLIHLICIQDILVLFLFLEMRLESARAAVTMRLSVCITALGPAVQIATVPSTLMLMQRHGSKQTPAGEVHGILRGQYCTI
jgi:hypothetical protein